MVGVGWGEQGGGCEGQQPVAGVCGVRRRAKRRRATTLVGTFAWSGRAAYMGRRELRGVEEGKVSAHQAPRLRHAASIPQLPPTPCTLQLDRSVHRASCPLHSRNHPLNSKSETRSLDLSVEQPRRIRLLQRSRRSGRHFFKRCQFLAPPPPNRRPPSPLSPHALPQRGAFRWGRGVSAPQPGLAVAFTRKRIGCCRSLPWHAPCAPSRVTGVEGREGGREGGTSGGVGGRVARGRQWKPGGRHRCRCRRRPARHHLPRAPVPAPPPGPHRLP